jgi:hypothetical protein
VSTPVQQAAAADVVVLAVPWPRVPQALEGLEWRASGDDADAKAEVSGVDLIRMSDDLA